MRRYKKYQQGPRLCPSRSEDEDDLTDETPSIERASDQDEDWQILLRTHKDIPCINFHSLEILRREREDCFACELRYALSMGWKFTRSTLMFAVEFDPSWMLDWPSPDFDILREASVRGMLTRLLVESLNEDDRCLIWLIDRRAAPQETSASEEAPGEIFYDMEHDYVEPLFEAEDVSEFIYKIGNPADYIDHDRRYDALWEDPYGYDYRGCFDVKEHVKVLVRRGGT
ncbi:hypothetical protein VFPPC_00926 [Pochonia chlamydosporia 170]|uniref:Uncharacterized protein n=1 Tax=Pochonia chlamydosporia 170 TaxID=1380566 RepID=A0A179G5M8_METCM|nr:hypothetical protein VFPPC_00926 [Pochonia chlamydosporia 170]OAQ73134.1 hypothetical protein VFPPC_00926 [Pochonia chlamydosporia 170]